MTRRSCTDPARVLPIAFALIATFALARAGAVRSFAALAPLHAAGLDVATLPATSPAFARR